MSIDAAVELAHAPCMLHVIDAVFDFFFNDGVFDCTDRSTAGVVGSGGGRDGVFVDALGTNGGSDGVFVDALGTDGGKDGTVVGSRGGRNGGWGGVIPVFDRLACSPPLSETDR